MPTFELIAFNTDSRYPQDVRYREYTTSKKKAEAFARIPKIQFTDSGHGIIFTYFNHKGPRRPLRSELYNHVQEQLLLIRQKTKGGEHKTNKQIPQ